MISSWEHWPFIRDGECPKCGQAERLYGRGEKLFCFHCLLDHWGLLDEDEDDVDAWA